MYYSRLFLIVPLLALLSLTTLAIPSSHPEVPRDDQHNNPIKNLERAEAVKAAFTDAWNGYIKYAFPNDELRPVTNRFANSRNGWGATAVDAFSTALVMQIPEIVEDILEYIPTINFDHTNSSVSLFETTIRYLGGMLSAYDLLSGPLEHLATDDEAVEMLLKQSERLANNMAFAFNTPTGIPSNTLNFSSKTTDGATTNGIATIGTLVLEWVRLSDLTGNKTYGMLAEKGESYLLNPKPNSAQPWPGLIGTNVNITTGYFVDSTGGWIGSDDSFYEYLLKMYLYDSHRYASYKDRWILAADSTMAHLASHPSSRPDLTFLAQFKDHQLIYESEHLACFDGGSFILGGLVLKEKKYIDFGLDLVKGCHETYSATATGIGPEVFRWVTKDTPLNSTLNPRVPAAQAAFYNKTGFYIQTPSYILRPEVIESYYYAYRATGDQMYREWAWDAFLAINSTCRVGSGFAELKDVNVKGGGNFTDFQDSFLFAEVLKYAFMIHTDDEEWQVGGGTGGTNEWVYNTEAHPFKVVGHPV